MIANSIVKVECVSTPRITLPTLLVLKCLSSLEPDKPPISGFDLAISSSVSRGSIYPILYRLEEAGWVESEIEIEGSKKKTSLRLYRLTEEGKKRTEELLRSIGQ